jgi:HSP20 family protein
LKGKTRPVHPEGTRLSVVRQLTTVLEEYRVDHLQPPSIRIAAIRRPFAIFHSRPWQPALNIYETEQALLIVAELAGVDPANLAIDVHPMYIDIRGIRELNTPAELRRIQRMEIAAGAFQIDVPLSVPVDPEQAEARYANGLLEVWLPFGQRGVQQVVVISLREGGAQ